MEKDNKAKNNSDYVPFAEGLLVIPSHPLGQLIITPNETLFSGVSDEDLKKYGNKIQDNQKTPRTSTEVARALFNAPLFLVGELSKRFHGNKEVLKVVKELNQPKVALTAPPVEFLSTPLQRKVLEIYGYDHHSDKRTMREKSTPGPVETVGLAVFDLVDEPELRPEILRLVTKPLFDLIQTYRLGKDSYEDYFLEAPEMPDLTERAIEVLDMYPISPSARAGIYELLEQIAIPDSQRMVLLKKMDKHGDLTHSLAFKLSLRESEDDNSPWIAEQNLRREQLLKKLDGSTQDLFEQYDQLKKEASCLVFSDNLSNLMSGKVGLEIEFTAMNDDAIYEAEDTPENIEMSADYMLRGDGIDNDWAIHEEDFGTPLLHEVTRADNKLNYGREYLRSLIDLSRWLKDNAKYLQSMHIHLDSYLHEHIPHFGGLFEVIDINRESHMRTIDDSGQDTTEIRPIVLPRSGGTFHAGRLGDIIGLFINAAKINHTEEPKENLSLNNAASPDIEQMVWGHLISYLPTPEARLAALMALHDKKSLSTINPLAFIHTFEKEDLAIAVEYFKTKMTDETDQEMIKVLDMMIKGDVMDLVDRVEKDDGQALVQHILGRKRIEALELPYSYILFPNKFEWIDQHRNLLLSQVGYTDYKPVGDMIGDGVLNIDSMIKQLVRSTQRRISTLELLIQRDESYAQAAEDKRQTMRRNIFLERLDYATPVIDLAGFTVAELFRRYGNEYFFMEDNPHRTYELSQLKNQSTDQLFKLSLALSDSSLQLVDALSQGPVEDVNEYFEFDSEHYYKQLATTAYEDLATIFDSPQGYARTLYLAHNLVHLPPESTHATSRQWQSFIAPAMAALRYAYTNSLPIDERFDPVVEIFSRNTSPKRIPQGFRDMVRNNYFGENISNRIPY